MAFVTIDKYIHLIPAVKHLPSHYLWSSYDAEADVLYVNFKKRVPRSEDPDVSGHADNSELTDDDVIIFYEQGKVIGLTILNASQCFPES
ncbi:hypothetical protein C6502_15910 [Candidatus Poribacteria bacterium]|nr:MAG: hypothetical protein C6502_15910 [Candidatus Poribacteria bacterium]